MTNPPAYSGHHSCVAMTYSPQCKGITRPCLQGHTYKHYNHTELTHTLQIAGFLIGRIPAAQSNIQQGIVRTQPGLTAHMYNKNETC